MRKQVMRKQEWATKTATHRGLSWRAGSGWTSAAICALLAPTQGHGFEAKDLLAFRAGPFVVRPSLSVSETYNDNLFYNSGGVSGEKESAFLTGVTPGVDVRLGQLGGDRVFHFKYDFNHYWYHGVEQVDTALAHDFGLTGTWRGNRLSSDTTLSMQLMDTVYGGYEGFVDGAEYVGANVERTTLRLDQRLRYQISQKTSAYGRFMLSDLTFEESPYRDYNDQNRWMVTLGSGYQIRPKVEALGEVHYGQTASDPHNPLTDKPPHRETLGGFVGANLDFTERLQGTVKVGYEQAQAEPNERGEELDYGAPIANISLTSVLTERSSATLAYDRRTGASVSTSASAYTIDNFRLNYRHALGTGHPVILSAGVNLGLSSYEPRETRSRRIPGYERTYYGANLGVAYQPRPYLTTGLYYRYTQSDSTSSTSVDYSVNEVTLAVSLGY